MDHLLVEVAGIAASLDQILARYSTNTSSTLFLIKSHVQTLETGVEDVRQWLHMTDPTSIAQIVRYLQDAVSIVKASLNRLWYDLESIRQSLSDPNAPPQSKNTGFSFDEGRMRLHLCDIRECASLVMYALQVCQSPVDKIEEREAKELNTGTMMLFRAHATTERDRRMVILDHMPGSKRQYSSDFNQFMDTVLNAEEDLLQGYSSASTLALQPSQNKKSSAESSWALPGRPTVGTHDTKDTQDLQSRLERIDDRDVTSAHQEPMTPAEDVRQSVLTRESSSSSLLSTAESTIPPETIDGNDGTPSPKAAKVLETAQSTVQRNPNSIVRKPVRQTSRSQQGFPSAITVARPMSMNSIRQRDALLALASPSAEARAGQARSEVRTSHLFREASGSLSTLTDRLNNSVRLEDEIESPPPYIAPPTPTRLAEDDKRLHDRSSHSSSGGGSYADIFRAIRENRLNSLRTLIDHGVVVDESDHLTQRTPLMEAAVLRRNEAMQVLIGSGARVHLKDSGGSTALHFAALQGDSRSCVLLLNAGAQLDEYNAKGETPLQLAARGGHTEAVVCLLNSWTVQRGNRQTLLRAFYEVSRCGNVSSAQAFVDKGVKPQHINESWSPISCAAESGSIPMLDFMISQGCSLKERSPEGWTALHFAARYGHTSMVEKLLALKVPWKGQTKKTEETALHLAAIAGHTSTALALIMHKDANVTMRDADGQQALHHAVRNGDLSLSTTLIAHGARAEDMNSFGWQPIHLAAAYGHLPLVADFLTRGISMEDKLGMSSLKPSKHTNEAARRGYWAEIRWPHAGARPLHLALEFGHDEVANVLISGGAKIEAADSHAWRPLHYAAFNCRVAMVNHLLSRGASAQATTDDSCTPLSLGFRQPGLVAGEEEKQMVGELLQASMDGKKKSKFKQFAGRMSGHSNARSRTAEGRNRAWHTAELAAALYQDYEGESGVGVDEGDSQVSFSENSQQLTLTDETRSQTD